MSHSWQIVELPACSTTSLHGLPSTWLPQPWTCPQSSVISKSGLLCPLSANKQPLPSSFLPSGENTRRVLRKPVWLRICELGDSRRTIHLPLGTPRLLYKASTFQAYLLKSSLTHTKTTVGKLASSCPRVICPKSRGTEIA